jgi:hypothetical protein
MTCPNLTRAFSDGRAWAVDRETGAVHSLPLVQLALIEGTREASIYTFRPTAAQAYAEQARVLAAIAGRN